MVDDYIRREDAVDTVPKERIVEYMDEFGAGYNSCRNDILRSIESLPSADVVQVVRCKECMHYVQETPYRGYCTDTHSFGRYWRPDDFCSYGEREE